MKTGRDFGGTGGIWKGKMAGRIRGAMARRLSACLSAVRRPLAGLPAVCPAVACLVMACLLTACATGTESEYAVPEGKKLVLYTSHKEEVYGPIVKEFEERTGIWVDVRAGGTNELMEAVRSESGLGTCDVMFGGGVEGYEAHADFFEPYACSRSSQLDPVYRSPADRWTLFTELPIVFIYNSKLVAEEDAPQSWSEFLGDRWKGKIAFADPRKSGTSYTALATMIQILGDGISQEDQVTRFVEALDGNISPGSGEVVQEVASGVRLVGITLEEAARKKIAEGADLGMVYPAEGTSAVPDGCAVVKDAPHKENARLFIDFTVSDDVQNLAMDQFCRRTVRQDMKREPEVDGAIGTLRITDYDLKWAVENQDGILKFWASLVD